MVGQSKGARLFMLAPISGDLADKRGPRLSINAPLLAVPSPKKLTDTLSALSAPRASCTKSSLLQVPQAVRPSFVSRETAMAEQMATTRSHH